MMSVMASDMWLSLKALRPMADQSTDISLGPGEVLVFSAWVKSQVTVSPDTFSSSEI